MRLFLHPDDNLTAARFYTALPFHLDQKIQERYRAYTGALRATGVDVVESHFKRKDRTINIAAALLPPPLRRVRLDYRAHEEKETDVNIALDMIDTAHRRAFDKCFLVSGARPLAQDAE